MPRFSGFSDVPSLNDDQKTSKGKKLPSTAKILRGLFESGVRGVVLLANESIEEHWKNHRQRFEKETKRTRIEIFLQNQNTIDIINDINHSDGVGFELERAGIRVESRRFDALIRRSSRKSSSLIRRNCVGLFHRLIRSGRRWWTVDEISRIYQSNDDKNGERTDSTRENGEREWERERER